MLHDPVHGITHVLYMQVIPVKLTTIGQFYGLILLQALTDLLQHVLVGCAGMIMAAYDIA